MIPTSDSVSSASNWQLFKSWVKHKLRSAFTWNRKTRVLEDPAALLQEARARGDNPYSGIKLRNIKRDENPQPQINRTAQHYRNDFARIGIDVSSLAEETDLFLELQYKLLTRAKSLQSKIYKQGMLEDMQACSRLVNRVIAGDWPAVLDDLTPDHPTEGIHELVDFVRPLQLLLTPPKEQSTITQVQTDVKIPSDQLLGKEVFLMSGDISLMNELRNLPIEVIACPYTPMGSPNETALLSQLSEIDPGLTRKGFREAIKKMKPGLAAITASPALQCRGFSHMVHAILPKADSGSIHSELVSAYQSAIEAAHRKNLSSIAIPIFSSELNLTPQRAATVACIAVSRYMSSHTYETRPPKVYLVCPSTEEGQKIQGYINHYLSQKMPKPPVQDSP
ncbi:MULTISPECIES: macro domain-containing protein [unclassified Endozoicomonas]|uniref:macro domain-containing protein n=1 Tax=unclassified Endozoicomonas TaxID=2644528 RepID=UPI0021473F0C|nr:MULTISPECIES: macro domain-containing protein [unclassified Endozoicomonas]